MGGIGQWLRLNKRLERCHAGVKLGLPSWERLEPYRSGYMVQAVRGVGIKRMGSQTTSNSTGNDQETNTEDSTRAQKRSPHTLK